MSWSTEDIPDLTGRTAVVTGFTGGLGLAAATELARHGASLVVTARDASKADEYLDRLRQHVPDAAVEVVSLDLADLAASRAAAEGVAAAHPQIDLLINNAGIMIPPSRRTADGFELQIGTNHLGHFAWTATLWPVLKASSARVVSVSSMAHASATGIDLRSLTPEGSPRRYRRWQSYGESKLANLVFAMELDRRIKAAGLDVVSVAAHPGYALTNLQSTGLKMGSTPLPGIALHQISRVVAQSAEAGAWPLLMAATDPSLTGGEYLGPGSFGGARGRPKRVGMTKVARDEALADALWAASESAADVEFAV